MRATSGVTLVLAGLLSIGFGLPASSADHDLCTLGTLVTIETSTETLYVENREVGGLWVYRENGLAGGLQRGGEIAGLVVDPCGAHPGVADDLVAHVPAP